MIDSVDVGDVLAQWHEPYPGIPGINVYGEVVEPPQPKFATFCAGQGVRIINGGYTAVAERPGRPVLKNNTISVEPRMIVRQDVDMSTGNIKFKGDVIVLGSVRESMKVEAGGMVEIKGSVYHAEILSGSHVTINNKLIGGRVVAGVQHAGLTKSLDLLGRVIPEIRNLRLACSQLKASPQFSLADLHYSRDGHLIKLVLEVRFAHISKVFEQLRELLKRDAFEDQDDDFFDIISKIHLIGKEYMGLGPLDIRSLETLEHHCTQLQDLKSKFTEYLGNHGNITVSYCQNAKLEATGDIFVTGSLVYDCELVAGDHIRIVGECRCGSCQAVSSIDVGSVGSQGMGMAYLTVSEGGSISARTFQPGVKVQIGPYQETTTTIYKDRTFIVQDGNVVAKARR